MDFYNQKKKKKTTTCIQYDSSRSEEIRFSNRNKQSIVILKLNFSIHFA